MWVSVWRWVREALGPRGAVGTPGSWAFTVCKDHACCCSAARGLGPAPEPSGPPSPLGSWAALDSVAVPSDGFSVRPGVRNSRSPHSPHPRRAVCGGQGATPPCLVGSLPAALLQARPPPGQHCGEGLRNVGLTCVRVLVPGHRACKL